MKRGRFCFTAAAVCLMVFGLSISAQAKTTYRLEITNQYDTDGTSRDDNDKDRVHPLEPDVEVSEGSSDGMELASDVEWSKDPLNWSAGNEVTGTLYLGCTGSLGRDSLELRVTNGRNEAKISSVKKYTGEDYESDLGNVYEVKFKYQVAAQLGETAWAGWDSANPSLARWNAVKYANTYRVVLYDDQGSVVSQLVEGSTEYDFSPFMTKEGVQYYFEVQAIARNGNQQDYLEDGEAVSSLTSGANTPGITDGTWGDYQEGRRFTYEDGTAAADRWERIMGKWYYFNPEGYAVTGWNQIQDTWYYMYEDGAMAAGVTTPDGCQVDDSGAWIH